MSFADFHTHTVFSDGTATVSQMIAAAHARGLSALGISDHSHTPFDTSYCMPLETQRAYAAAVRAEQKKALEQYGFPVLLGIELDYRSDIDREAYDYTVGSVHYICKNGEFYPVDSGIAKQKNAIENAFGGNKLDFAKAYFEDLVRHAEQNKPTFIGHFDLLNKYGTFDECDPAYFAIAKEALAEIVKHVPLFEVNMGAMARGLRTVPYPAPPLLVELLRCGGKVILSSDAHCAKNIAYRFDDVIAFLKRIGFSKLSTLTREGVCERAI